jgi:hypothetical protein
MTVSLLRKKLLTGRAQLRGEMPWANHTHTHTKRRSEAGGELTVYVTFSYIRKGRTLDSIRLYIRTHPFFRGLWPPSVSIAPLMLSGLISRLFDKWVFNRDQTRTMLIWNISQILISLAVFLMDETSRKCVCVSQLGVCGSRAPLLITTGNFRPAFNSWFNEKFV